MECSRRVLVLKHSLHFDFTILSNISRAFGLNFAVDCTGDHFGKNLKFTKV
jgi:hypothetical protein